MAGLRIAILVAALIGLSWFGFINQASARELGQSLVDRFDPRPVRTVLLVGNGRTYWNGMPTMVRKIADSAGAPHKYQISDRSRAYVYFKDHWSDDRLRKQLTARRWDAVILQGASSEHVEDADRVNFHFYGDLLVDEAERAGSPAYLVVAWEYGPPVTAIYDEWQAGFSKRYFYTIQRDYRALAQRSGADLINVGRVWRYVTNAKPPFPLLSDGSQPTVHGSYLYALVIYARLSGEDLSRVSYVPDGVTKEEGVLLRKLVDASMRRRVV
jgi:hypothetical protein